MYIGVGGGNSRSAILTGALLHQNLSDLQLNKQQSDVYDPKGNLNFPQGIRSHLQPLYSYCYADREIHQYRRGANLQDGGLPCDYRLHEGVGRDSVLITAGICVWTAVCWTKKSIKMAASRLSRPELRGQSELSMGRMSKQKISFWEPGTRPHYLGKHICLENTHVHMTQPHLEMHNKCPLSPALYSITLWRPPDSRNRFSKAYF